MSQLTVELANVMGGVITKNMRKRPFTGRPLAMQLEASVSQKRSP